VVIGDSNNPYSDFETIGSALRQWVEAGGGVVGTGWTIYSAGSTTPPLVPDINAVIPVDTTVGHSYSDYYSSHQMLVGDNTHPITQGLSDFELPIYNYAEFATSVPIPAHRYWRRWKAIPALLMTTSGLGAVSIWRRCISATASPPVPPTACWNRQWPGPRAMPQTTTPSSHG